jgi:hypothetical protein
MKAGALHARIHDEVFEESPRQSIAAWSQYPKFSEKSACSVSMIFGEALPLSQPAACFALGVEASWPDEAGGRSLFLEVCSGSCRVSRSFENKGQEALGVDSKCNKS